MADIGDYLHCEAPRFEEELIQWLAIPSVSAQEIRRNEVRRAAAWAADQLRRLAFQVEEIPTAGHPLVYAESPPVGGAPVALVYGHYDVQPAEPLEAWTAPPFAPARRGGRLYARGASDDKGQVFTHIKGVEALQAVEGRLPLQVKFLLEGEEEIGSPNLHPFVAENAARLACDCVVISDTSQFAPGLPGIVYGLRGIAYYDLLVRGPHRDLHSGSYGGAVTNPANALARMLSALFDDRGRVTLEGFYDDVVPLSDCERRQLAELPFDEKRFLRSVGVDGSTGEEGYTVLERRWARPTCDLCGLTAGYQGEGAKTVLPATASAKISFRLVPHQDPEQIGQALKRKLAQVCPPGIRFELSGHHGSPGVLVSLESPYLRSAAAAIERAFGRAPVFIREGGSIPVVATLHQVLEADLLLLGWGQEGDQVHAPDESFALADFHRGIRASAELWKELGR